MPRCRAPPRRQAQSAQPRLRDRGDGAGFGGRGCAVEQGTGDPRTEEELDGLIQTPSTPDHHQRRNGFDLDPIETGTGEEQPCSVGVGEREHPQRPRVYKGRERDVCSYRDTGNEQPRIGVERSPTDKHQPPAWPQRLANIGKRCRRVIEEHHPEPADHHIEPALETVLCCVGVHELDLA